MTKQDILRTPVNFLYVFSNPSFERLVAKYISAKAANTILTKRLNQTKYIDLAYDGVENRPQAYSDLTSAIQQQYGITPQKMLNDLLAGKTVAGKNWKKGVYGIAGETQSTYNQQPDFSVNPNSGAIQVTGANNAESIKLTTELQQYATPIFANNANGETYIDGYAYDVNGYSYTTKRGDDGKYYANTYGDGNVMQYADGTTYSASSASSVWENIATAMPEIQKLLEWIASLVEKFIPVQTKNVAPAQTEFVTNESGVEISSVAIMGAVALGSFLLMKNK